jgi:hypothetical protein
MIELNLLPEKLRKKKKKKKSSVRLSGLPVIPGCLAAVGVLVALYLLLSLLNGINANLSVELTKKWEGMKPQREFVERVSVETRDLEKKLGSVEAIEGSGIDWTRLLMGLNEGFVSNIWLSNFRLDFGKDKLLGAAGGARPKALELTGYALGRSETATLVVARFINSLKANGDFSSCIDDVELVEIKNVVISEEEAMQFKLICKFKAPQDNGKK